VREPKGEPESEAKKNLLADLLAVDLLQEVESSLGRQAVQELDLEVLEIAVRQQTLRLAGEAVAQRLKRALLRSFGLFAALLVTCVARGNSIPNSNLTFRLRRNRGYPTTCG
jgi:hypothetical protein